ncbi:SNF2-related protein [Sphingomonas sp. UYEF23]|uniref:DEAD/DEAH box helicase n=1 Tax=Sphingomonas sp. UYEF23 TaxID=1756408 RepID=UPI0033957BDD
MTDPSFPVGAKVHHAVHGAGRVVADVGATIIVRFNERIESLLASELRVEAAFGGVGFSGSLEENREALLRAQALAIRSVNDQWGVFSRSRVQLLPHQLWVCHRVNRQWPFRWLVADDVGLGKTIECGLVLMPLIASGRVRRLLILAPAKLVPQWQARMRQMFDIRLQAYAKDGDTERLDFWGTANMVVASIHTLRDDRRGARARLLDAEPWDAVVVDEAHHLNADERLGETLAYSLLRDLEARRRVNSLLFFTGTPHRGKDFGFFALMRLVRPDLFDPDKDTGPQMHHLADAMIRNNKSLATDLRGNRLFTDVTVSSREYGFSAAERLFYDTLSGFILDGRAYAATFDGRAQSARMLLLITLQKLAASSIAAVRNALAKRRERLASITDQVRAVDLARVDTEEPDDLDEQAEREENVPTAILVQLMDDEIARLDELIALADGIPRETKITRLVDMIDAEMPADEPVLFFTEYKATQTLVLNALQARFGHGCAAFINGDERLDGVINAKGVAAPRKWSRDAAADAFNQGGIRFLVSTEAAGEGIDLQDRCATLVHVDMPWNPMRLHQRVGRLSRYGQKRPVSVFILRNPDTVEARIWDLLNTKLERIQRALGHVMDDAEDISQLVVGMSGSSYFSTLFSEGHAVGEPERLQGWFDQATSTLGGEDIVDRVKALVGNVARFDFQQVGKDLPQVDLSDLERFFSGVLARHGRRVFKRETGLEVKAPDEWVREDYALRERYEGLAFDRTLVGAQAATRVVGVGHRLFDRALREAEGLPSRVGFCARLEHPLLLIAIEDEVTGGGAQISRVTIGLYATSDGVRVLRDWEVLLLLNGVSASEIARAISERTVAEVTAGLMSSTNLVLAQHAAFMTQPKAWPELLLLPDAENYPIALPPPPSAGTKTRF